MIYNNYVVLSIKDLFNNKEEKVRFKSKYKIGSKVHLTSSLQNGDYVVHELFGIGIYQGLFTLTQNGMKKDYIKVLYANDDYLYIPVENIDRVSKFSGNQWG